MALKVDLNKAQESLKLSLVKAGIITPPNVDIAFNLDVSGSFDDEHRNGLTNDILARLVPWGLVFDPDKKLDVFTFSDGLRHAYYVGEVTEHNYQDYVQRNIINKVPGYNSGTDYAYVLQRNLEHFGWLQPSVANVAPAPQKGGMFGGLFSKKESAPAPVTTSSAPVAKRKSLILHITDGDNNPSDEAPTEKLLEDAERRGDLVYVMFFGMSNQRPKFRFLKHIADRFSNTGLYICYDIPAFLRMSDDEINGLIIQQELIDWLKK